jgi:ATP dependent DNA ligase domain
MGPRIKLDGYRMAARIDNGRVQLLTRTGLDWTAKYPSAIAALANVNVKTAYLDGELCGVDDAGLPSFAHTQAATDGGRNVNLVFYAFDLLHLGGRDVSSLSLVERKARRRRRARLCRPRGHGDAREGACGSAAASRSVEAVEVTLSVPPPSSNRVGSPLVLSRVHWVESGSFQPPSIRRYPQDHLRKAFPRLPYRPQEFGDTTRQHE